MSQVSKRARVLAFFVTLTGCGTTAILEPPPAGLRARQTKRWALALDGRVQAGDLFVSRLYGPDDDVAVEDAAGPFSRVGIVDAQLEVIDAFGDTVRATPLREALAASHRVVVLRAGFVDTETAARAAAVARSRVGQPSARAVLDMAGGVADLGAPGRRGRTVAFLRAALESVAPALSFHAHDPAELLDQGELIFDSGPRR